MTVLAIIGLVLGLVVAVVVLKLLNDTLTPLRSVLADVQNAHTAPMLERGVPGTDQLGQTRRLADSVPPLGARLPVEARGTGSGRTTSAGLRTGTPVA